MPSQAINWKGRGKRKEFPVKNEKQVLRKPSKCVILIKIENLFSVQWNHQGKLPGKSTYIPQNKSRRNENGQHSQQQYAHDGTLHGVFVDWIILPTRRPQTIKQSWSPLKKAFSLSWRRLTTAKINGPSRPCARLLKARTGTWWRPAR